MLEMGRGGGDFLGKGVLSMEMYNDTDRLKQIIIVKKKNWKQNCVKSLVSPRMVRMVDNEIALASQI